MQPGLSFFPGDVADLPVYWVASLEAAGLAVRVAPEPVLVGPREVEITHRDTFARAKRNKR